MLANADVAAVAVAALSNIGNSITLLIRLTTAFCFYFAVAVHICVGRKITTKMLWKGIAYAKATFAIIKQCRGLSPNFQK